jgi:MscS family membrane protein
MKYRALLVLLPAAALAAFVATQDLHLMILGLPFDVGQMKFGMWVWQWIALAGLLVASALIGYAASVAARAVSALGERIGTPQTSRSARRGARRSIGLLTAALFWQPILPGLELTGTWARWIGLAVQGITVAAAIWLVYSVWDGLCDAMTEKAAALDHRAEKLLVPVTRKLVRFLIVLTGALIGMAWMGANVAGVMAGLGIGGLAVALAAKDSVENIFGSLTILLDMPFAIGDWVKIGPVDGVVEEINLRSTRIRTFQDSLITLPNSNLIKASVENFGARRYRQLSVQFTVPLDTKPEALDAFTDDLKAFVLARPKTRRDPFYVAVNDLTDAGLIVLMQFFIESETYEEELAERSAILRHTAGLSVKHGLRPPAPA